MNFRNPVSRRRWAALPLFLLALVAGAAAAPPTVFVIGDSISIQYDPYLAPAVNAFARYDRKQDDGQSSADLDVPAGANGGDTRMVLNYLHTRERDPSFRPQYLAINAGLHDIKRDPATGKVQVGINEYRRNLEAIHALSRRIESRLVWITTTPVEDERHNARSRSFHRFDRDRAAYDAVAREVMGRHRVPIIDLHAFTKSLPGDRFIDHVHYDEPTRAVQAAFIAGALEQILSGAPGVHGRAATASFCQRPHPA